MPPTLTLVETLKSLIILLKTEKQALLASDFSQVAQISEDKARLSTDLRAYMISDSSRDKLKASAGLIDQLKKLSKENARLLQSAKSGVQQAHARLDALKKKESVVGTYTENGTKLAVHGSGVSKQKIA